MEYKNKKALGGMRLPNKLSHGTQRLLKVLWNSYGGLRAVGRLTGIPAQKFIHWRNAGKVSYRWIGHIHRTLGVPISALDFEGIAQLHGEDSPSWKEVLNACNITREERAFVLKGKEPKGWEG